jgi:hypothetical protein
MRLKEKRGLIKLGIDFSLCGPAWDVGVGFNKITAKGGVVVNMDPNVDKFRLGDFVSAFRYSAAIVELISRDIPSNDTPERAATEG